MSDTPLWRILGWQADPNPNRKLVQEPDHDTWVTTGIIDSYVTETHLLDWLDANTRTHGGHRLGDDDDGMTVRRWEHWAMVGYHDMISALDLDRRAAIVDVVRQVHAAIGGES